MPTKPVSYPPNPVMEKMIADYLEENKKPFTSNEVASELDLDLKVARQALYNLRNAEEVYQITFKTKEINWMHKTHLR